MPRPPIDKRATSDIVREFETSEDRTEEDFRRYRDIIRDSSHSWLWRFDRELQLRKAFRKMKRKVGGTQPGGIGI